MKYINFLNNIIIKQFNLNNIKKHIIKDFKTLNNILLILTQLLLLLIL